MICRPFRLLTITALAVGALGACTQTHQREIDGRVRRLLHLKTPPGADVDGAARAALLRLIPPGSSPETITAHLQALGFRPDSVKGSSHAYYFQPDATTVEARLEDYIGWPPVFDAGDWTEHFTFVLDATGRLADIRVERTFSGL
jgi:hypothetical protein